MRKLAVLLSFSVFAFAGEPAKRVTAGEVSVIVPDGWLQVDVEEVMREKLETKFTDSKYERRPGDPKAARLVVMQKIPDDLEAPSAATIQIATMPVEELLSLEEIASTLATAMTSAFEGVEFEKPLYELKLGGLPAYAVKYHYTAVTKSDDRFPMRTALAMTRKGKTLYMIGYGGPAEGPEDASGAWDEVLKSFDFAK